MIKRIAVLLTLLFGVLFSSIDSRAVMAQSFTPGDVQPATGAVTIKGVNFNSANTDNAIQVPIPSTALGYLVTGLRIFNASQTLTTATFGLFTQTGAGGTAIIAAATAITVSTASFGTNNSAQLVTPANANTQAFNSGGSTPAGTLQFRVGTAQGAAATGDVELQITWVY